MLNNPRILILDEPTAGLDPKERVRFRNLISAFSKDRIVILSTHIVSDVEFIAEDIIMMKDGQILHFGKTQEITTEIDGQVWECTVPTSRAEQYSETLNISNLRNIENNCTVLRGLFNIACAIPKRCFIPPEKVLILRFLFSAKSTASNNSVAFL